MSTFIAKFDEVTVATRRGNILFKNVLRFNIDKNLYAFSSEEIAELRKVFDYHKTEKYYFKAFKTKKDRDAMYKTILSKYGDLFEKAADAEVITEAGKTTKKSTKKTTKKSEPKAEAKKSETKKTTKKSTKKSEPKVDIKDIVEEERKVEEEKRDNIIGYDWHDVIRNQGESIKNLNERFADMNAQMMKMMQMMQKMMAKA